MLMAMLLVYLSHIDAMYNNIDLISSKLKHIKAHTQGYTVYMQRLLILCQITDTTVRQSYFLVLHYTKVNVNGTATMSIEVGHKYYCDC